MLVGSGGLMRVCRRCNPLAPACPACFACPAPWSCSYGVSYYKQGNDFGWMKIRNRVAFKTLEEQVRGVLATPAARQLRRL